MKAELVMLKLSERNNNNKIMSGRTTMEQIKQNTDQTKEIIQDLKTELCVLNKDYNNIMGQHLLEENAKLSAAVEKAKKQLVDLEVKNGVKQIPLPSKES